MTQPRARRGYTYEPCPGCGIAPTLEKGGPRKSKRVCFECLRKLEFATAAERTMAERADLNLVHLAWAAHGQEYLGGRDCGPVQSAFWELAKTLGEVPDGPWRNAEQLIRPNRNSPSGSNVHEWPNLSRLVSPAQIQAFRSLWDAVKAWGERTEEHAKQQGSSLLVQLASGQITADQLNERTLRNKG